MVTLVAIFLLPSFFCCFLEKIVEIFSAFLEKSKQIKNNPLLKKGKILLIRYIVDKRENYQSQLCRVNQS